MTNPVIDNIRRSLGRTDQSRLSLRPAIYPARQPESDEAEIAHFLAEIKKLSGVGQRLAQNSIADSLKTLVVEQNVRKATIWNTPMLKQMNVFEALHDLNVELIAPNADKHDMAQCDLGITEADFILPETGTIVLRSSAEKPRAVSLLPRIHLAIVTPIALRADMHQVFCRIQGQPLPRFYHWPQPHRGYRTHHHAWCPRPEEFIRLDDGRITYETYG